MYNKSRIDSRPRWNDVDLIITNHGNNCVNYYVGNITSFMITVCAILLWTIKGTILMFVFFLFYKKRKKEKKKQLNKWKK